jgi:hypothetical protein
LVRYDKASGEKVPIQPMPGKGEAPYRWNWDAPLLVSTHDPSTLYFAANKLFKTTNKGDDWTAISPDLTQQLDRNKFKLMGQVWTMDAVMKNASTTIYGNIIALDESPKKKGLLYAGTDDGLIQVSENDGKTWMKYSIFPGVPINTRVNMLTASLHDENTVFAVFNSQRQGDFKPYILKSLDKGKTWTSISSNLPERGNTYCLKQDHVDPNLLFLGTEFGAYFSNDAGLNWTKLSGLPTIAVYDLDIQKRENDLVAATFGRGFYVLDNYTILRSLSKEILDKKAHLFPVKDALLYVPADPLGLEGTGFQGHNMWSAKNPEFGAVFSLHLKDEFKTLKSIRQEKEKLLEKDKKDVDYPSFDEIRKEENDEDAKLIWIVSDALGKEIRRMTSTPAKGLNNLTWNLRSNNTNPIKAGGNGFLVSPGIFSLSVCLLKNGSIEVLVDKQMFNVRGLNNQTLIAKNPEELIKFRSEVAELNRKVSGSGNLMNEAKEELDFIIEALINYPNTDVSLLTETRALKLLILESETALWGDKSRSSREFETVPSISSRLDMVGYQIYENTAGVTNTHRSNKMIVEEEYASVRIKLDDVIKRLEILQLKLESVPIPYTKKRSNWRID